MQIADITKKMIAYSEGNTHDINHFLKVWSFARTIGQLEGLDDRTQEILEAAETRTANIRKKKGCRLPRHS